MRIIACFLVFTMVAGASRGFTGSDVLTSASISQPDAHTIHIKEQHTWADADANTHVLYATWNGTTGFLLYKDSTLSYMQFLQINGGELIATCPSTGMHSDGTMNTYTGIVTSTSSMALYINGVACNASTGSSSSLISQPLLVGNYASINPWIGSVWDAGYWNSALTVGNVATLNACGTHPSAVGTPAQEWDLVGSSLASQSGGSALTATGTTVDTTCNDPAGSARHKVISAALQFLNRFLRPWERV